MMHRLILSILITSLMISSSNMAYASDTSQKNDTSSSVIDQTIAVANDQVITSNDLDQAVALAKLQGNLNTTNTQQLRRQVLQQLINQKLALQIADQAQIHISDAQVQQMLNHLLQQNRASLPQLQMQLTRAGVTLEQFKSSIRDQLRIHQIQQQALSSKIQLSPAEIQNYIDQNLAPKRTLYQIQSIDLPVDSDHEKADVLAQADQIVDRLQQGKLTFQQAQQKYGSNNTTEQTNTWEKFDDLPKPAQSIITKLHPGKISQPISTDDQVQIIKLLKTKPDPDQQSIITQYHLWQVIVPTSPIIDDQQAQDKLNKIRQQLANDDIDLTQLAEQFNKQHRIVEVKDRGWMSLKDLPDDIATHLKSLDQGQISQPIQQNDQWMLIIYTKTRDYNNTDTIEKQKATNALLQSKAPQAVSAWMRSLRQNAYVKTLKPKLKDH